MKYLFSLIFFLSIQSTAYAVFELGGEFGYQKQVFGESRQNSAVDRSYSASLAIYLFANTGIEFNYSRNEEIITENSNTDLGSGITLTTNQSKVDTDVYGLGLRQGLLPSGSMVIPIISAGYAKKFTRGSTEYTLDDNGTRRVISIDGERRREDAVFGAFTLQIKLTRLLSLKGSVKTVFPAFEFSRAKDSLMYSAGFSWFF